MDITELEAALTINPYDPATLVNLGKLYINDDRIASAIRLLGSATDRYPNIFLAQNYLADAYYLSHQPERAIPHYQRALHLRPDDAGVLANLWVCRQETGNTSYRSQHGEDLWIAENLALPSSGVFVDVGAEDGITGSNTYHFEQAGWTGICIEPNPLIFTDLRATRTCLCVEAAIASDPDQPFYVSPTKGWSGLLNEGSGMAHVVPIRRLDVVLDEAKITHIDLLSIDTEGTELDVLATLDLMKYTPAVIIIEWNTWDGKLDTKDAIERYFAAQPYQLRLCTTGNLILTRR